MTLHDCQTHQPGAGSELLIVEGDSAAAAALAVRDPYWQAILPMQGRPMNTVDATATKVQRNKQFRELINALGTGFDQVFNEHQCRYDRIVLLFDPDADGILSRSILLLFFDQWMHPLLRDGRVFAALPPLWQVDASRLDEPVYAHTQKQLDDIRTQLADHGVSQPSIERYRGLASLPAELLRQTCVNPDTRRLVPQTPTQAEQVRQALGHVRKTRGR